MTNADFSSILKRVVEFEPLDAETSQHAFDLLTSGEVGASQTAAFLTALAVRNPTVEEIVGAARALRAKMLMIEAPEGAIDVCGTGGDNHGTLNVSTAVSIVLAASGVPVAKHGNRNMSSRSGAADVLEALGAKIDLEPGRAVRVLRKANLCFLFAQTYHPAMRHVAPVRRSLGFRTIFNLLGPLCNPAGVKRQLVGVYSGGLVPPIRDALARLGTEKVWVVHGTDGMDELTTTGITLVGAMDSNGATQRLHVEPEDAGLPRAALDQLKGGTAAENADSLRRLLDGERGAYRDIVLLNGAAALIVAGRTKALREGVAMAAQELDGGNAKRTLEKFIAATRDAA